MEKVKTLVCKDDFFAKLRFVYIAFYLSFVGLMELIPVLNIVNLTILPSMIFNLIAVSGALLLLADFITRGVLFKPKYAGILILFFVFLAISIIANVKYGVADNLKTFVWSLIQIFLVASVDYDLENAAKLHKKHFKKIYDITGFIWTLAAFYSICMFLGKYGAHVAIPGDSAAIRREGFIDGRLFGAFTDPNYAAIIAFTVAFVYLIWVITSKNIAEKIIRSVMIFINFCYIVLSASRTVEICLYLAALLAGFWGLWLYLEKKGVKTLVKIGASVLNGALCLLLCVLLFMGSLSVLPYTTNFFGTMTVTGSNVIVPEEAPEVEEPVETPEITVPDTGVDMTRPELENTTDITNNRMYIWTEYLRVFQKAWLTGTSPRTTIQYADEYFDNFFVVDWNYSTHNAYLSLFVCTGLFGGLAAFLYLVLVVVEILGYLIRKRKNVNDNYIAVLLLTLVLMAYAVCGFSYQIIFFNNMYVTVMFWVLLGYTRAFVRSGEPERIEKDTLPFRILSKVKNKVFKKA